MAVPGVTFRWHGTRVTKDLENRAYFGALAAANHFAGKLKQALLKTKGSVSPPIHSAANEIPFYITREYAKSITIKRAKREHRVSIITTDKKGPGLEFGTSKMAPRPAWRITLRKEKAAMTRIMGQYMRRRVTIEPTVFGG